jgi:hypothetical protein
VDNQAIYITSNQYSFAIDAFKYVKLRILDKAQLYDNTCGPLDWKDFTRLANSDGSLADTVQPAHTFGTPGVEYLVNVRSDTGATINLWILSDPIGPNTGLSRVGLGIGAYSAPQDAEQCNTTTRLETLDARLQNAVYRDGILWTAHTITCQSTNSRACIRLISIDVSGPFIIDDFEFGKPLDGFYYYFPAVMTDNTHDIYVVFNRSSSIECVGIRYTGRLSTEPTNSLQPSALLKGSTTGYTGGGGNPRRWGDYSGIALDPENADRVWVAGEYAIDLDLWGTWIGKVFFVKFEVGEVTIDDQWKSVAFSQSFSDPIVVATPLSKRDGDPAAILIRNVTSTGFQIRLKEWEYLDGSHLQEYVGYLVIERGHYRLANGAEIEAGTTRTDATGACTLFGGPWKSVSFQEPFSTTPVVLTSVTTFNAPAGEAVTSRTTEIGPPGFKVRMQEQEANDQIHTTETISYLAWTPGSGTLGGLRYEVGRTGTVVTEGMHKISFGSSFSGPPAFLAHIQTFNGCDTATLRWQNKTGTSVYVQVQEEQSADPEITHAAEDVGYIAFECSGCATASTETAAVFRVTKEGTVYSDRAYYCGLSSNCFNVGAGADLAERIDVTEPVEPGDVIEIDPTQPGRYRKAREPLSPRVVGVIATAPGITLANRPEELRGLGKAIAAHRELRDLGVRPLLPALAGKGKEKEFALTGVGAGIGVEGILTGSRVPRGRELLARLLHVQEQERLRERLGVGGRLPGRPLLALMGRVYVKATTENGPIRPGDLLVSASLPGYAMRCPEPSRCEGAILGKALEPLEEGTGRILMLLMK